MSDSEMHVDKIVDQRVYRWFTDNRIVFTDDKYTSLLRLIEDLREES